MGPFRLGRPRPGLWAAAWNRRCPEPQGGQRAPSRALGLGGPFQEDRAQNDACAQTCRDGQAPCLRVGAEGWVHPLPPPAIGANLKAAPGTLRGPRVPEPLSRRPPSLTGLLKGWHFHKGLEGLAPWAPSFACSPPPQSQREVKSPRSVPGRKPAAGAPNSCCACAP